MPLTCFAQGLPDPTRPPGEAMAGGALGTEAAASSGPVLQAAVVRPGAKPRALISGEWVEQGGHFAAFRLVKVTTQWVILKGGSGKEIVYLTPQVKIHQAQVAPEVPTGLNGPDGTDAIQRVPKPIKPPRPSAKAIPPDSGAAQ
jgi:hypothetical protein